MWCKFAIFAAILAISTISPASAADGYVKMTLGNTGNCKKYTEQGFQNLQIATIKLLTVDGKGKITNIVPCTSQTQTNVEDGKDVFVQAKCKGSFKKESKVVFSVRLVRKNFVTNDIEYRYNEDVMQMRAHKTYDPSGTQNYPFNAKAHLFIKNVEVYDGSSSYHYSAGTDDCFNAWPNFLIADHGIYTMAPGNNKGVVRMYFDPYMKGEYYLTS